MTENSEKISKYLAAAENEKYEADMVWRTFSAFLLAQTIFLAFLLQSTFGKNYVIAFYFGTNIAALFGLLICIPWMISFYRSMAFFNLRVAQSRAAEPEGWNLLNGEGVNKKYFKIPKWIPKKIAKRLTTRCSVVLLIWFFIGIYITIFIISGPWNPQPVSICL
jgi:hypothetical protein